MYNELLEHIGFTILNKILGNCKIFGIDKQIQKYQRTRILKRWKSEN